MSFNRPSRPPRTPTLPQGETVATYGTYLDAQRAVEVLAEKSFPLTAVTIVGTDLRMVERVTGKLSYPRVASGGFLMGAWFGLFLGLVLTLFETGTGTNPFLPSILLGGAFGLLMSVLTYAFTRGRRDFTSSSQIVAASYAVLCRPEDAHQARNLLQGLGGVSPGWPASAGVPAAMPSQPPPPGRPTPPRPVASPDDPDVSTSDGAPGPAQPPAGPETPTQPPAPPQS